MDAKQAEEWVTDQMRDKTIDAAELYAALVAIGATMENHESDLYVKIDANVMKLIARYKFRQQVKIFQSDIPNGGTWYDIPFAYAPWWANKSKGVQSGTES